jgi:hypothetical protein
MFYIKIFQLFTSKIKTVERQDKNIFLKKVSKLVHLIQAPFEFDNCKVLPISVTFKSGDYIILFQKWSFCAAQSTTQIKRNRRVPSLSTWAIELIPSKKFGRVFPRVFPRKLARKVDFVQFLSFIFFSVFTFEGGREDKKND